MSVVETYSRAFRTRRVAGPTRSTCCWASLAAYSRVVDRARNAAVLAYRSTKSLPREHRQFLKQVELETNELIAKALQDCIDAGLFRQIDVDLVTYQFVLYAHTWALEALAPVAVHRHRGLHRPGFDFFVHAMATPKGLRAVRGLPEGAAERKTSPQQQRPPRRDRCRPASAKPAAKTWKALPHRARKPLEGLIRHRSPYADVDKAPDRSSAWHGPPVRLRVRSPRGGGQTPAATCGERDDPPKGCLPGNPERPKKLDACPSFQ